MSYEMLPSNCYNNMKSIHNKICSIGSILSLSYHPLINPRVNPIADILPLNGMSKLVIANEEAVGDSFASSNSIPSLANHHLHFQTISNQSDTYRIEEPEGYYNNSKGNIAN